MGLLKIKSSMGSRFVLYVAKILSHPFVVRVYYLFICEVIIMKMRKAEKLRRA